MTRNPAKLAALMFRAAMQPLLDPIKVTQTVPPSLFNTPPAHRHAQKLYPNQTRRQRGLTSAARGRQRRARQGGK